MVGHEILAKTAKPARANFSSAGDPLTLFGTLSLAHFFFACTLERTCDFHVVWLIKADMVFDRSPFF